jgi:hypothetical protein
MAARTSKQALMFALRLAAVAALSAACASVLGIETTKRTDRASRAYGTGYEGCRRNSCSECLSAQHLTNCQGSAGFGAGYDGCTAGDCSECQPAHEEECNGEAGYGAGYDGCQAGTCSDCISPAHECLCQGLAVGCFVIGSGDAGINPQICEEDNLDGCAECLCSSCDLSTCLADAACNDVFSCVAQFPCNPSVTAVDTCYTPEFCKNVIDNAGGPTSTAYSAVLNLASCAEQQQDCGCSFGAQATPGGCEAGVDCPSEGGPVVADCEAPSCTGCLTTGAQCLCNGNSVDECLEAVLGDACETHFQRENDACHGCSCNTCSSELLSCFDDAASGCVALARCINIHQCEGAACDTPDACGDLLDLHGGIAGNSFQMAMALTQCQATADCPCTHAPDPQTITCGGDRQCAAFVEPGPDGGAGRDSLPACCFSQLGSEFCGLEMTGVLYTGCEPRGLSGSPANPCGGFQTDDGFPYNGAFLSGCCRPTSDSSAMNGGPGVCGYNDTVTGLRCLPIEKVTGMSVTPTPCNYVR